IDTCASPDLRVPLEGVQGAERAGVDRAHRVACIRVGKAS
ncbi:MAG: hypothetical protein QOH14_1332, partial [Pseudonocardiales bacterium]|nr:hypothetical protein [Pseudonocardiales bacterium]